MLNRDYWPAGLGRSFASNSFGFDVSRFFTGSPTNKTVWLLIGGVVVASVGFFGLFRGSGSSLVSTATFSPWVFA